MEPRIWAGVRGVISRQYWHTALDQEGKFSSGNKTKHVKAKFFFIKDIVDNGEIKVIDCPAEEM
jgi:hypothetical protein